MKIRIIGHAGSGKTTLSKELEERYGYTIIPLDSFIKHKDKKKRKQLLNRALDNNDNWVIEGVQEQRWCRRSFSEADIVIVLEYPLYIVQYRVIKRTIQRMPKTSKERKQFLIKRASSLLKWNKKFTKNIPRLKKRIYGINSNLYTIRSPKDIDRVHTIIGFYSK